MGIYTIAFTTIFLNALAFLYGNTDAEDTLGNVAANNFLLPKKEDDYDDEKIKTLDEMRKAIDDWEMWCALVYPKENNNQNLRDIWKKLFKGDYRGKYTNDDDENASEPDEDDAKYNDKSSNNNDNNDSILSDTNQGSYNCDINNISELENHSGH